MQASMLVQLPIAVGAPALAAGLAWHWRNGPPQGVAERRRMQFNPLRRAMSYIKRYSTLEEARQRSAQFKNNFRAQVYWNTFPPICDLPLRFCVMNFGVEASCAAVRNCTASTGEETGSSVAAINRNQSSKRKGGVRVDAQDSRAGRVNCFH